MNVASGRAYSLGLRLSWMFAFSALTGFGVMSMFIYGVAAWSLERRAEVEMKRKKDLVLHLVAEGAENRDQNTMRHKLDEFFERHGDMKLTLNDDQARQMYESPGPPLRASAQRELSFDLPTAAASAGLVKGRVVMDGAGDQALLTGLATALFGATALGALVVSMSGFWLVRRSMRPLRGLAEQTRALGATQLGLRLALDPPVREVQPWVDQFNALMDRLEYAYGQLENFNADVAHELRTPLTSLIGQTELLLTRERSVQEFQDTVASNLEEMRRLATIVNDMLFLARADRGARASAKPPSSLRDAVAQVLDFHEGAMADCSLTSRIEGDAQAAYETGLVRRAVSNLIGNATRYARPGSEVVVQLFTREDQAWIVVTNEGEATAQATLPRVFDRFYRVESSRPNGNDHHGLGLAIVSAVARMHGGFTLASSDLGLTRIGFSMRAAMTRQSSSML